MLVRIANLRGMVDIPAFIKESGIFNTDMPEHNKGQKSHLKSIQEALGAYK
jgi:hypothetical protein